MTSYLPNLARDNLSFYLIPAAWTIALMPRFYAVNTYKAATSKTMDTAAPRSFPQQVSDDQACDSKTKGRVLRAEAAVANSFENLGLFAAAVVAGNTAGVDVGTMNGLALGYVGVRLAYNHIYIFQDVVPPLTRTAAYFAGIGCCMAMFVQAGMAMNSRTL